MKQFPFYPQMDQMDCGPACLRMIARHHGKVFGAEHLREKCAITRNGVSVAGIADAAESIGMSSLAAQVDYATLRNEVPLPCIAHWRQRHFIVVYAVTAKFVHVADPGFGLIKYPREEFLKGWQSGPQNSDGRGLLLLLEPTPRFYMNEGDGDIRQRGLGFLRPYLRPYRRLFVQLAIGLFVGSSVQLIVPFLTQAMVDHGIQYQNLNFVYLLLLGQLTLFFSQTTVTVLRSWLILHIGSRVNISIISNFLIKLMRLPIGFFDSKTTGDLLQRVQDHNRIDTLLSSATLTVLFSAVSIAVFGVVLAYYDLRIFLLFLVGTIVYVLWVRLFMKQRAILDYKRFDQAAGNQSSIIQLIQGMQEIKLNNSERRRRWEWEAIQVRVFRIAVKGMALIQWQSSGATFINELKNILITFVAAQAVIKGDMTLGMMLAVQYIIGQLNVPINNFITFIQSLQDARISIERLSEIHARDDEEDQNEEKLTVLPASRTLTISGDLSFRYGSAQSPLVLEDINLEIPEGKVTAIVGASGSGKTTLLKLLLRFYKPLNGTIRLGNVGLENVDARIWRGRCGAVMQNGYIFADTIARNITESDSDGMIDRDRLLRAVRIANLEEFIESLPLGYNTRVGSAGIGLSGGQNQRILIARAAYKDPDFLFFDEATSALDALNERVIMQNLAGFCRGRTVVVIAHRLSTVRNADQIIVLDRGRMVEHGRHEELTRTRGAYFLLVKNQLELGTD
ncbi:MAG TPA: peptidase domain-containing ABC transporter [Stellaceae bacterium]|jgi:ATP-binding cassette subfamily B protein|nr:peptidase domain-containing ABC transporter [Stellaceae bacterium]